ncbi:MAG TPA: mechanosensitive ion channel family protein [Roseovarius sp.]
MEFDLNAAADIVTTWLDTYLSGLIAVAPKILIALVIVLLTWGISRLAGALEGRIARRLRLRQNLIDVLLMMTRVLVWLAGILIALTVVFPTITPGKALTTLGLGSIAIGFAFKDTFENFLAGILILLREPFAIGDFVECESVEGRIEAITIRDTRVRRTDGQLVVMPNHELFQNPVTVRTDKDLRRTTIICGVGRREDVDRARDVIQTAVEALDTVRSDIKDVQIFAQGFGDASIDFEVTWWTGSTPLAIRRSRDQVVAAVKRALDDAGIEIPYPYRVLTFSAPVPVEMAQTAEEGSAQTR